MDECLLDYILKNGCVKLAPDVRKQFRGFDNFIFIIKWVDALGSNKVVKICEILQTTYLIINLI